MSTTSVFMLGHAAVAFERDGTRLVIDPGVFSSPAVLTGSDAILVTHDHVDHADIPAIVSALDTQSGSQVWGPASVVDRLLEAGAPPDRVHTVAGGDAFTAAGFEIAVLGHRHAIVHPSIPQIVNVAYLIDGIALHPGDSFTPPPTSRPVTLLFVPIAGPWMKVSEAVDYTRDVAPAIVTPIHDGILNDAGKALVDRVMSSTLKNLDNNIEYRRNTEGPVFVY